MHIQILCDCFELGAYSTAMENRNYDNFFYGDSTFCHCVCTIYSLRPFMNICSHYLVTLFDNLFVSCMSDRQYVLDVPFIRKIDIMIDFPNSSSSFKRNNCGLSVAVWQKIIFVVNICLWSIAKSKKLTWSIQSASWTKLMFPICHSILDIAHWNGVRWKIIVCLQLIDNSYSFSLEYLAIFSCNLFNQNERKIYIQFISDLISRSKFIRTLTVLTTFWSNILWESP